MKRAEYSNLRRLKYIGMLLSASLMLAGCNTEDIVKPTTNGKVTNNNKDENSTDSVKYKYTSTKDTTEYSFKDGQYVLPVICHVFYSDKNDSTYIPAERISHIFDKVNQYYKANNIGVTFRLTTLPPKGKGIDYVGVEYIPWKNKEISESDVMGGEKQNAPYKAYLWDPNRYINVMFYAFKPENNKEEYITLGVSHLPLTYKGSNQLNGLQAIDSQYNYLTLENIEWAPCSSINSTYAYEESSGDSYNTADVTVTLAHELGHYLGLLHAFTENNEGEMVDSCYNSDYCKDTPSYNRVKYMTWLEDFFKQHQNDKELRLKDVALRTGCEVDTFISHNIMDYFMSFTDEFTTNQKERIYNVLKFSPLMPRSSKLTRTIFEYSNRKVDVKIPVINEPAFPIWKKRVRK